MTRLESQKYCVQNEITYSSLPHHRDIQIFLDFHSAVRTIRLTFIFLNLWNHCLLNKSFAFLWKMISYGDKNKYLKKISSKYFQLKFNCNHVLNITSRLIFVFKCRLCNLFLNTVYRVILVAPYSVNKMVNLINGL